MSQEKSIVVDYFNITFKSKTISKDGLFEIKLIEQVTGHTGTTFRYVGKVETIHVPCTRKEYVALQEELARFENSKPAADESTPKSKTYACPMCDTKNKLSLVKQPAGIAWRAVCKNPDCGKLIIVSVE